MADISEVMDAIRDAVSAILYPGGVPSGPRPISAGGSPVRIYVGWPGNDLEDDLSKDITHVTIWPRGTSNPIDPYLSGWTDDVLPVPSLTAGVSGDVVTFGGNASVPRMIAAVIMAGTDRRQAFTLAVPPNATPTNIATAFAALISPTRPATADGPILTIPDAQDVVARVFAGGQSIQEVSRERQGILVTIWAPTQLRRDTFAKVLTRAFLRGWRAIPVSDGTLASISVDGTSFDEAGRQHPLRRRDLMLTVEFSSRDVEYVEPVVVTETGIEETLTRVERVVIR